MGGLFQYWPWRAAASPSGFCSSSTAEQVTEGIDASHLTAIVTGATSGIGRETARVLALRGARVIIPSRTVESGLKVRESLLEQNPKADVHVMEMDLSSLDSVDLFAQAFCSSHKDLNILINNAGIMACPFQLSRDGIEIQFATNHLGQFLLTNLLIEKMKFTAKQTGVQGRIINVSSSAHRRSNGSFIGLDRINDESRYNPFTAYSHSKVANILHANELSTQLKEEGSNVTINSLHPGVILTNIGRHILPMDHPLIRIFGAVVKPFSRSIPQGAATTCYLALHRNLTDVTGKYFENCNEATPSKTAKNEDLAREIWGFSEELVQRRQKPTT